MASWLPKMIKRAPRKKSVSNGDPQDSTDSTAVTVPVSMIKFEIPMRAGMKSVIIVPPDMTNAECSRIKTILGSLVVDDTRVVDDTK